MAATDAAGRQLVERLTVYPNFARAPERWLAPSLHTRVLQLRDGAGLAREENWSPGTQQPLPTGSVMRIGSQPSDVSAPVAAVLDRLAAGDAPSEQDVVTLFDARGQDFAAVCAAADGLRRKRVGDTVSYVVNRNINYTNICTYACAFCALWPLQRLQPQSPRALTRLRDALPRPQQAQVLCVWLHEGPGALL